MGNISPSMWDDNRFCACSAIEKLIWVYLLTGPESTFIPGLLRLGVPAIADGVRLSVEETHGAAQRLIDLRLIELDPHARIVRVPNAPRYNPPGNPNVVLGWYRRWRAVPESDLKARHVTSLRSAIDYLVARATEDQDARKAGKWRDVWSKTFGSEFVGVPTIDPTPQQNLFRERELNRSPSNGESFRVKRDPLSVIRDPKSGSGSETIPQIVSKRFPDDRIPASGEPPAQATAQSRARRLWERQEALRASVPGLLPLRATTAILERVEACLAELGASELEAEHVLAVYHADALREPEKARWFDGAHHWQPRNFQVCLGKPVQTEQRSPSRGKHFKVTGAENYGAAGRVF